VLVLSLHVCNAFPKIGFKYENIYQNHVIFKLAQQRGLDMLATWLVLHGSGPDENTEASDKDDLVTKLFGWAMPKPEKVGLSRFDRDTLPENYPATKTEFAELLPDDESDADKALMRPLLARTNLEKIELKLAFDSKKHGLTKAAFHGKVDEKGPAVMILRTKSGVICGGYNPTGWVNLGEARGSIAAFLFLLRCSDGKEQRVKLQKIGGAGMAQMDDGGGPKFGPEGLTIALETANKGLVRSKLGLYYENLPNGDRSLFGKNGEDEIESFKV